MLKIISFNNQEVNNMSQEKHFMRNSFLRFMAGCTIGAITALLFAPTSGKRLRRQIKNKSDEYYEDLEDIISDAKLKAKEIINDGRKKSEELVSNAMSRSEELLKKAEGLFSGTLRKTG
jgi:gas vesicle protein